MNPRPEPTAFGGFGEAPRSPSGTKRIWPFIKAATTKSVLVLAVVGLWHAYAPEPWRPEVLAGTIAGKLASSEILAASDAQIAMQRRMNDLNTEMQIRLMQAQAVIQQQSGALEGEQNMAKLADMGCIGSMIVGALAQSYNNQDWQNGARNVGQATCGVGGQIRQAMTQEQVGLSKGLLTMASAGFDDHAYKPEDIKALDAYFDRLPDSGKREIMAGLDREHATVPVVGDRIMVYYRQHGL